MKAFDLDGTLLDFSPEGQIPRVNMQLVSDLAQQGVREIAVATNQGGVCFGVLGYTRRDGRSYPTPEQFFRRLDCAGVMLARAGIAIADVRVSCWHKAAETQPEIAAAVQAAARQLRAGLHGRHFPMWRVYTTAAARKPQPLMLRSVGAAEYWGDSDEDEGAALAAGIPFVRVERFF